MSLEVHGVRQRPPMYKVVINQLQTDAQQASFDHWTTLRRQALEPRRRAAGSAAGATASRCRSTSRAASTATSTRAWTRTCARSSASHDAVRRRPEVDAILDGAVVIFNVIQNPDGRVVGLRANGNGFDLNRDFLTQSQSETKASVRIMQEWLPPETLDLHGYVTPTLIEATTKPHNPGIDYDLWLKWNQSRIDANEAALNAVNLNVTRPINDWCSDGRGRSCRASRAMTDACGPAVAEGWDDWGPFYTPMYSQLVGLNGSTVEMCQSCRAPDPTEPRSTRCACYLDPDGVQPDRPQRGAARAARDDLVDAALRHGQPERAPERPARDLPARRRRRGARRRAARRRSTSRTTGCTSSRPRT